MPDSPSMQSQSPGSPAHDDDHGDRSTSKTPKDRPCPFCQQPFTSSSLGRHLDLYIKSINPKPPDGLHNVAKIREMRGKITRRQPRGSLRKSEIPLDEVDPMIETEAGTADDDGGPGQNKRQRVTEHDSPRPGATPKSARGVATSSNRNGVGGSNWQGTGVIPGLPVHNANMDRFNRAGTIFLGGDLTRSFLTSPATDTASPRPQTSGVETGEVEELSRATQFALHEVLDSLSAARAAYSPTTLFDFDFLGESFPGLCLRLLPAPRTIFSTTPFARPETWPISVPGEDQKEALREAVVSRARAIERDPAVAEESELALRHLDAAYASWTGLGGDAERERTWHLEVMRMYSRMQRILAERTAELRLAKQQAEYFRRQYELAVSRPGQSRRPLGVAMPISPEALERFDEPDAGQREWTFEGLVDKWRRRMRDHQKTAATDAVEVVESSGVADSGRGADHDRDEASGDQGTIYDEGSVPRAVMAGRQGRERQQGSGGGEQSWLDGAGKMVERVLQRHGEGTGPASSTTDVTNGVGGSEERQGSGINEHGKRGRPTG